MIARKILRRSRKLIPGLLFLHLIRSKTAAGDKIQQAAGQQIKNAGSRAADQERRQQGGGRKMIDKNTLSAEELQNIIENLPEDDKGNKVAPDSFFDEYFKLLPNGTKNASGTYRSYNGGRLLILGADPERDKEVHRAGAEAVNAMHAQRRTFKEQADILLGTIDKETGKTCLENMTVAMYQRALEGDVKAYAALRDTAGEQPVAKSEITADIMTAADREVIKNALARLKGQGQTEDQEE